MIKKLFLFVIFSLITPVLFLSFSNSQKQNKKQETTTTKISFTKILFYLFIPFIFFYSIPYPFITTEWSVLRELTSEEHVFLLMPLRHTPTPDRLRLVMQHIKMRLFLSLSFFIEHIFKNNIITFLFPLSPFFQGRLFSLLKHHFREVSKNYKPQIIRFSFSPPPSRNFKMKNCINMKIFLNYLVSFINLFFIHFFILVDQESGSRWTSQFEDLFEFEEQDLDKTFDQYTNIFIDIYLPTDPLHTTSNTFSIPFLFPFFLPFSFLPFF